MQLHSASRLARNRAAEKMILAHPPLASAGGFLCAEGGVKTGVKRPLLVVFGTIAPKKIPCFAVFAGLISWIPDTLRPGNDILGSPGAPDHLVWPIRAACAGDRAAGIRRIGTIGIRDSRTLQWSWPMFGWQPAERTSRAVNPVPATGLSGPKTTRPCAYSVSRGSSCSHPAP